jgi:hypothetical protein
VLRLTSRSWLAGVIALTSLAAGNAGARDLFVFEISIDGDPALRRSTNRARDIPELFDDSSLLQLDPGYIPSDSVSATLDLRGLAASVSYAVNDTALRLLVPAAGIDLSLDGGSRDASQELLESFLQGNFETAGVSTTDFLQALLAHSPVDPVAGNPNSLESRMFAADFRMGTSGGSSDWAEGSPLPSLVSLDIGGSYTNADGFDVAGVDLPFHASIGFERLAVVVDVPIAFTSTQGAWTGMGSGGIGLRVAPTSWWALTPAARIGGVGSLDVGGLAVLYNATLTSHIRIPVGPLAIGIGNMGGYTSSIDAIEVAGYELDYGLTNWVTRNGAYIQGDFGYDTLGLGLGWRVHGSDVRFFGTDLYMDNYAEVGASASAGAILAGMGIDVSYFFGRNTQGVSARVGLRF